MQQITTCRQPLMQGCGRKSLWPGRGPRRFSGMLVSRAPYSTLHPTPPALTPYPCFSPLNPSVACSAGISRSRKQQEPGLGEGNNQDGGYVRGSKPRHPTGWNLSCSRYIFWALPPGLWGSRPEPGTTSSQERRGIGSGGTGQHRPSGKCFRWKQQVYGKEQGRCREQKVQLCFLAPRAVSLSIVVTLKPS